MHEKQDQSAVAAVEGGHPENDSPHKPKKRRRKRGRKTARGNEETSEATGDQHSQIESAAPVVPENVTEASPLAPAGLAPPVKPKRARAPRGTKKAVVEDTVVETPIVMPDVETVGGEGVPKPKPRRRTAVSKTPAQDMTPVETVEPAPPRKGRKKKEIQPE